MTLARSFVSVLGSGLAVNATTFVILAAAPLVLTVNDFAHLSLGVAAVMFLVSFLDMGLGITSTRQFAATKNLAFLSLSIRARLLLCAIFGIASTATALAWPETRVYAIATACAVMLNLWTGLRAADQAREDFAGFAKANLVFAGVRLALAGTALFSGSWIAVMLGLFAAPVGAIVLLKAPKVLRLITIETDLILGRTIRYAGFVFVSSVCYAALIALPMAVAGWRLDPVAIGTIGIAATFVGPISLLNNALRLVLLPRVSTSENPISPTMSPKRWMAAIILPVACVLLVWLVSEHVYSDRFPLAGAVTTITVAATILVVALGLLNMDVHRLGTPGLEAVVNLCRLLVTAPLLWLAGTSVLQLSITAAALLVIGEAALFAAVRTRGAKTAGRRHHEERSAPPLSNSEHSDNSQSRAVADETTPQSPHTRTCLQVIDFGSR